MTKVKVTKKDIQQVVKLVSPESRAVREYLVTICVIFLNMKPRAQITY